MNWTIKTASKNINKEDGCKNVVTPVLHPHLWNALQPGTMLAHRHRHSSLGTEPSLKPDQPTPTTEPVGREEVVAPPLHGASHSVHQPGVGFERGPQRGDRARGGLGVEQQEEGEHEHGAKEAVEHDGQRDEGSKPESVPFERQEQKSFPKW